MALRKMSLAEIRASRPRADLARIAATSEADIRRHMAEDGEGLADATKPADWAPRAATIRRQLGMTQAAFAAALRVPLATLRNWEQGRVAPDPAARALLLVVAREPEAALRALSQDAA